MKTELTIAGASCFVLAVGHAAVGRRWVLPNLKKDLLPRTPFGSSTMTLGMLRFTWHVLTVVILGFSTLLVTLAWTDVDARKVALRWVAALMIAGVGTAVWNARHRPRDLVRLPVTVLMILVAIMCLLASSPA
jgi:hypothetical protein